MKIRDAYITFARGERPIKASMTLEKDDFVELCEIDGGEIHKEENNDILFRDCLILNCEYKTKDLIEVILPCPIVNGCVIKNCKLPHTYYVGCIFRNEGPLK